MKLIICGDTHLRLAQPYQDAIRLFLRDIRHASWNVEGNTFLHAGDLFDSSALSGDLVQFATEFWESIRCKRKIIIQGNHDVSRKIGSALKALPKDVEVFYKMDTISLLSPSGKERKVLLLPHPELIEDRERYATLDAKADIVVGHFAVLPLFGSEIPLPTTLQYNLAFFGHVHKRDTYKDCYIGVPVATMYNEDLQEHRLVEVDLDTLTYSNISLDAYLRSYEVEWGSPELKALIDLSTESDLSKLSHVPLVNILNAPSVKAVYDYMDSLNGGYKLRPMLHAITVKHSDDDIALMDDSEVREGRDSLVRKFLEDLIDKDTDSGVVTYLSRALGKDIEHATT